MRAYRANRPFPELQGRTVILVDDGVATGATARAAERSARRAGAAHVVLAAPVIAAAAEVELRRELDDVVALDLPSSFIAVGFWYERFGPVSDSEVLDELRRYAPRSRATRARGGAVHPGSAPRCASNPELHPLTRTATLRVGQNLWN